MIYNLQIIILRESVIDISFELGGIINKNFNYEIKRKFNKLSEKTVYPSDLEIGDNFEIFFQKI